LPDNRAGWQALLKELDTRQAFAEGMGGESRIARQHTRGRQTARERIAAFVDTDSFTEYGALAGACDPSGGAPVPADGLVGGTARVLGRAVVLMAEDATVQGGSIGHPNAAKRARLVRLAGEESLPLVLMLDGAGERASNAAQRYPSAPGDLQLLADLKGKVPIVCLVLGHSAGHGALTGMFADLLIVVESAALFTAGPPLVEAALGVTLTPEELGGAVMHATQSGVAHNLAGSEQEAMDQARYFLSLLPSRSGGPLPLDEALAVAGSPAEVLLDVIPPDIHRSYDIGDVVDVLADSQSFFELQPGFGRSLVVGIGRIAGIPTLVMANQPAVQAGAITREAAEKASHFLGVGSAFGLPLLSLVDNPGVMPGPEAERAGVLRAAAAMFAAQRRYRGRKLVVTLRKAFGFGSSVMGMNPWDRQAISLALPTVSLGGVPASGAALATGADEAEAHKLQASQSGAWAPADAMALDRVVDPRSLRREVVTVLSRDFTP
jgi:acetyl-CoA carboxylase carboxyltransferase component